jgi:hypothetical protein
MSATWLVVVISRISVRPWPRSKVTWCGGSAGWAGNSAASSRSSVGWLPVTPQHVLPAPGRAGRVQQQRAHVGGPCLLAAQAVGRGLGGAAGGGGFGGGVVQRITMSLSGVAVRRGSLSRAAAHPSVDRPGRARGDDDAGRRVVTEGLGSAVPPLALVQDEDAGMWPYRRIA